MPSAERLPGREHIPSYPRSWVVLRILQLVLALLIIGLCAYSLSISIYGGACLMLFTAVITLIISIWLTCAHSRIPRAFNYWAALAFDIFLYIFWLISFAVLAVEAAARLALHTIGDDSFDDSYLGDYYGRDFLDHNGLVQACVLAAASGLGALQFLFFFISWITDAIVIYRHRKVGLHCKPLKGGEAALALEARTKTDCEAAYTPQPQPQQYGLAPATVPVAPQPMAESLSPAPPAAYGNQTSYIPH